MQDQVRGYHVEDALIDVVLFLAEALKGFQLHRLHLAYTVLGLSIGDT